MNMDNKDELFPVVDEDGHVLGKITRGKAHDGSKVLHPVVHLHVFNSRGELYLQQRPHWKDIQPDKWDTACGGHVDYGETVEQALHREVSEELGITFTTVYDGKVYPSKDELAGGRFWSPEEIKDNIGKRVFTPNFENEYREVIMPEKGE